MRIKRAALVVLAAGVCGPAGAQGTADVLRLRFQQAVEQRVQNLDGVLGIWIRDLKSGAAFGVHSDEVFPAASSIKIGILFELYRQAEEGGIDLAARHRVRASDRPGGSGVLGVLGDGTVELSVRDLAVLMISVSHNTATNILIDRLGMDSVNATLGRLGLERTRLRRKMVRPEEQARDNENLATPAELGRLLEAVYRGEILTSRACQEILDILKLPPGPLRAPLPNGLAVAHKTGSLAGVRNDVGLVLLEGRPYIVSAMSAWVTDVSDAEKAIEDVSSIAYAYFSRLRNSNAFGAGLPPEHWKR